MISKALKNIFILVFFVVTSFSTNKICAANGASQVKNEIAANFSQEFPNGELERVQHPSAAGWNITALKNLASAALSQGVFVYKEQIFFKSPLVKTSSLRIKDYLFHIHPSHHFW
ncbi:MAG TPA: hypothetical protein VK483_04180 [Chitinophagaceae bacterium]|nr:hypothetical protein [Chitinophagaceae bacterium]